MRKLYQILPLLLFLLIGCSTDVDTLQNRGDILYKINSEKPFTGSIFRKYEDGQYELKGYLKNGKVSGIFKMWYSNGQKRIEGNFKDGI